MTVDWASRIEAAAQAQPAGVDAFAALLARINDTNDLRAFADALLTILTLPVPTTRQALIALCLRMKRLQFGDDRVVQLYKDVLELIRTRGQAPFEDQVQMLREQLASTYEAQEEWKEAARTLMGIPLDSGHRTVADGYKLETYVRVARLLLEADDPVEAETFLNRASHLLPPPPPPPSNADDAVAPDPFLATRLAYRLSSARILDYKRRFVDAGARYLDLSYAAELDPDDRLQCLGQAIICAVLAPAGPQRSRLLAQLYKDPRVTSLPHHQSMLTRVHLGRFLSPERDVKPFQALLAPHHLALTADGRTTVLDRAMIEHNLQAAAAIYDTVALTELTRRVGVERVQGKGGVEEIVVGMVREGRVNATVDRVDGWVTFRRDATTTAATVRQGMDVGETCALVEQIVKHVTMVRMNTE